MKITGLDRAAVLAALYNASKPQGMGFLHYDPTPMTREEAADLLKGSTYFDYLKGRVMKIDLSNGDEVSTHGYDRDNGEGAAEKAIAELRKTGDTNSRAIQETHFGNTVKAARDVNTRLQEATRLEVDGDSAHIHLGLSDVAGKLGPAVNRVTRETVKKRL